jgi:catechol 2,3-dioxygenase
VGVRRLDHINYLGAEVVSNRDWQPVNWTEAERAKRQAWRLKTIESLHTHGTPPVAEMP